MSSFFTRTKYDTCATRKSDSENTHAFNLNTDTQVRDTSTCHPRMSPMTSYNGAHGIPHANVDISSELRGQTRMITRCPESRYNPYLNCTFCDHCNLGLPCGCTHCQKSRELDECDESLNPSFTRLNKSCNYPGITIDRFHPFIDSHIQENPSLPQSGVNTRVLAREQYAQVIAKEVDLSKVSPTQCRKITKRTFCQ